MDTKVKKQLFIRPVLSEKSLDAYRKNRVCTFWIAPQTTKSELKKEFNDVFGIVPLSITTVISRRNKSIRTAKKFDTSRKYVKKAYVNIGDKKLDIFENIS